VAKPVVTFAAICAHFSFEAVIKTLPAHKCEHFCEGILNLHDVA
jgi:hypothetical protein